MSVDSGILAFANHGCHNTYNVGSETTLDEFTVDEETAQPGELNGKSHAGTSKWNPVIDRHLGSDAEQAIRNVAAGEELLDNYIALMWSDDDWAEDVEDLREQCSGEAVGVVSEYENSHQH